MTFRFSSRLFTLWVCLVSASFLVLSSSAQAQMRVPKTVAFAPMNDPWPLARERWLDINNNQYSAWLTNGQPNGAFSYGNAQVQLTFDGAPTVSYFVGHIQARGLKPNFSYQLKLLGKPERGTRGWGTLGDDLSNERIGMVNRWWCDSQHASQTNFDDAHYYRYYKYAPAGREHNIYGYHYMGEFVTDQFGNADVDITGQYSYHITWASWQNGFKDKLFGTFPVQGGALGNGSFYGYGSSAPNDSVTLYYEYQSDRPHDVVLPNGNYKCRFVLTEETFHNTTFLGGYWKGVLATEDYDAQGRPDQNPANDVNFSIGAHPPILADITPTFIALPEGSTQTFTAIYRDADNDLRDVFLRVGTGSNSFTCNYSVSSNRLYARSNSSAWQGGVAPGSDVTLATSTGTLNCKATQVTKIAGGLRIDWNITAATAWTNTTHPIASYAKDFAGLTAGWKESAWWQIGGNQPPVNVSLSPFTSGTSSGVPHVLTTVHSDPNGAADIPVAMVEISNNSNTLRGYYDARRNLLYLLKEDGKTLDGGFAPGSNHVISNTLGSLDCATSSVAISGTKITVNWGFSLAASWAGSTSNVSLFTRDWQGAHDGFERFGTWTVTP